MSRICTAAVLALAFLSNALWAQSHHKATAHVTTPPGTNTITSFDRNHTVIGWLEIVPLESKIFHETRLLRVLVPANYFSPYNAHRSYPVLYMQNGQTLFDAAISKDGEWHMDETVEHLVGSFKIPPMFVVGIDDTAAQGASASSTAETHVEKAPSPEQARADEKEYARYIVTEVMPFIEKYYRVSRGPTNTGLGGSLLGGDVAIYTALEHPGVFGHVLVESPVLGQDDILKSVETAKLLPHKMYIGLGVAKSGDSRQNAETAKDLQELESVLRKKGMTTTRLKITVDTNHGNDVAAWSDRLPEAMVFLYGASL